jgi:hypothetical protein
MFWKQSAYAKLMVIAEIMGPILHKIKNAYCILIAG